MTRHTDEQLDELARRAVGMGDEEVAAAWSDNPAKKALLQEITAMPTSPSATDAPTQPDPSPSPSRRLRLAIPAVGVLLVAVALVVIPSSPPAAFAGWSTEPADIPDATRAAIDEWCRAGYSETDSSPVARLMREAGPAELMDMRGGAALAIWSQVQGDKETTATCTVLDTDGDGTFDAGGVAGGVGEHLVGPMSYMGTVSGSYGMRVEVWHGRVADADRVVVVRGDGVEVEASLADSGRFLAWWPGDSVMREIITLGSDGSVLSRWSPPETAAATP